jgi:hypothetical protein
MPYCGLQKVSLGFSLLAVTVCAGIYVPAQSQRARVSTLELGSYGWQPLPKRQSGQGGEWLGIFSQRVSIDHKGRVLVGFTARDNQGLGTRERPGLFFHLLRFTSEGKLDISLVSPTKDFFTNGFYLGANDQILVRANDTLQALSAGDEAGKEGMAWRVVSSCPGDCYIKQSFSRRTMILITFPGTDHSTYTILDTSSSPPRVEQTCSRMAFYGQRITDKFAYWAGEEGLEPFTRRFAFCDLDHPQELPLGWGGIFFALNDDTFLRLGADYKHPRSAVEVAGSDGRIRFRHELPEHDLPRHHGASWVTADERGDRFAFIVDTWRGGSRLFDTSGKLVASRILVYTDAGQELASVPVNTTIADRTFGFSMSPDGQRLAILEDDAVKVVDLEEVAKTDARTFGTF